MNALATSSHQSQSQSQPQLTQLVDVNQKLAMFEKLVSQLPQNEYDLPVFIYRADLLPHNLNELDEDDRRQLLQLSAIATSYREGYPTFDSGLPLWSQMDHEDSLDYEAFQHYLNLSQSLGYRQLVQLEYNLRSEIQFKDNPPDLAHLRELFVYNFWAQRAKAHDLFMAAAHKKLREARLLSIENRHYLRTERLLDKMEVHLDTIFDPEKIDQLDPETAVKILKSLHTMQRESLGIADGSRGSKPQPNDAPPNATMEVALRSVAKQSGADLTTQNKDNQANSLELLLKDDDSAEMAQSLIIRMSVGNKASMQKPKYNAVALESDLEADREMLGQ